MPTENVAGNCDFQREVQREYHSLFTNDRAIDRSVTTQRTSSIVSNWKANNYLSFISLRCLLLTRPNRIPTVKMAPMMPRMTSAM